MSVVAAVGLCLIAVPVVSFAYAYAGYPALLWLLTRGSGGRRGDGGTELSTDAADADFEWPPISISLPAYNEEASIGRTLERLLDLEYPAHRRQIVVVSDASTDATDGIVRGYADRGVELVRLEKRSGKTAAEAAAIPHLTGDIVVNTDATISIPSASLKPLVRAFSDPTVGVASGRDVSVAAAEAAANDSESSYVGYEMWVRGLETRLGSIVGASGCFYAIRRHLHRPDYPPQLSRDFASCLIARAAGYRSVSVDEAVCYVPRVGSLEREYRRKVRTMARGLSTLWHERALLDPLRHGRFAWMLVSHKLSRWLVWLTWPTAVVGLGLLALVWPVFWLPAAVAVAGLAAGWVGWKASGDGSPAMRGLRPLSYAVMSAFAGFGAWARALRGRRLAIWEPTRR